MITKEQIEELQKQQDDPRYHGYTCCSYDGCDRNKQPKYGALIPTEDGWICPCGKYKQEYRKNLMTETNQVCEICKGTKEIEVLIMGTDTDIITCEYCNKKDIKNKIKDAHYHKYDGIAPEGFILIPKESLEKLKDFEVWKQWTNNPEILEKIMIEDTRKY